MHIPLLDPSGNKQTVPTVSFGQSKSNNQPRLCIVIGGVLPVSFGLYFPLDTNGFRLVRQPRNQRRGAEEKVDHQVPYGFFFEDSKLTLTKQLARGPRIDNESNPPFRTGYLSHHVSTIKSIQRFEPSEPPIQK